MSLLAVGVAVIFGMGLTAHGEAYRVYVTTTTGTAAGDQVHCYDSDKNLVWSVDDPVAGVQQSRCILLHTNNLLYLPAWDGARVQLYDRTVGTFVTAVSIKASPGSMDFGPDGYHYVLHGEGTYKGIRRYNPTTGADLGEWIAHESGMSGIAFGPHDGHLYVCGGSSIKRYNGTTGASMGVFATAGNTLIHLVWEGGYLYASDLGPGLNDDGTIQRFDTSGTALGAVITPGAGGLDQPWGFDIAPNGDILIADYNPENLVRRYSAAGAHIDNFPAMPNSGKPWSVTVGLPLESGFYVYTTGSFGDTGDPDRMFGYDSEGQMVWETEDSVPGSQGSRALELVGDELYTTRWDGDSYQRYARDDGAFLGTHSTKRFPNDIAFGPDGYIYLVSGDGLDKGVHRYNPASHAYIDEFVDWDTDGMTGIEFGPHDGYLYVCAGTKIKRYDNTGTLVEPLFATAGTALTHLVWRNGYLFASDLGPALENDGAILAFDTSGTYLGQAIAAGTGSLDQPWGFGFTPEGDVLVCDYNPDRIIRRYNGMTGTYAGVFADPLYNCTPWDVVIWEVPPSGTLVLVK